MYVKYQELSALYSDNYFDVKWFPKKNANFSICSESEMIWSDFQFTT